MLFDKLLNALKLKEPEDNNYDISTTADTHLQESDIPITTDAIDSSPENEERSVEETVPVLVLQSQSPSNIPIQATPTENIDLNTTEQTPPLSNGNLECESLMQPENNFEPQPDVSNDVDCTLPSTGRSLRARWSSARSNLLTRMPCKPSSSCTQRSECQ